MNKYKLKKEYPNSPEVGYVIEEKLHYGNWGFILNCFPLYPEKYPEFWEKVVEQDYEILSFKPTDKHTGGVNQLITLQDVNYYRYQYNWASGGCTLDEMIVSVNKGYNSIHSVKRLSDGEVFTVGDFVDINNAIGSSNKNLTITGFNIGNVLSVLTNDKINNKYAGRKGFNISIAEHSKRKPLFRTEDGVDIYEGDYYWGVYICKTNPYLTNIYRTVSFASHKHYDRDTKYFSTKEAAEEYILMNKPCLSINDINKPGDIFENNLNTFYIGRLKELVKKRL